MVMQYFNISFVLSFFTFDDRMRVTTTVVVICFVSVLAMAIGAPRPCTPNCKNNNQGKSGERKKNRAKGRTPAEIPPLPGTTGREEDALTER